MITQQRIMELFSYDETTGIFIRKCDISNYKQGTTAGTKDRNGYIAITVDRTITYAHRLAWLYVYGKMPAKEIDHINGDKADNRIHNLRDVTRAVQAKNMPKVVKNNSACIGVAKRKDCNRWAAKIQVAGKNIYLGIYKTYEEAVAARIAANKKYGFSDSHGRLQEMAA